MKKRNLKRAVPALAAVLLLFLSACGSETANSTAAKELSTEWQEITPSIVIKSQEETQSEARSTEENTSEAATRETESTSADVSTEAPTLPLQPGDLPDYTGSFVLKTAKDVLPVPESVSRKVFDNPNDPAGCWYAGSYTRDLETGEVVCSWDRPADVLEILNRYDAIYTKNADQKVCYLTFDCGGTTNPENVYEILDILEEKNVKAIFFIPGDYLCSSLGKPGQAIREERAETLRAIVKAGHLLGNHSYTHPTIGLLENDEDVINQLNTLQLLVNEALGYDYQMIYYRPPSGSYCERDLYVAKKLGYSAVLWSYAYMDYSADNQPPAEESLIKAEKALRDGSVYLLHAMSSTNRTILPDLIDFIRGQGYELRRLDM